MTDSFCAGCYVGDTAPTMCGIGQCAREGIMDCRDNGWFIDCTPGEPSPERCDGLDNDCNGWVDDGYLDDIPRTVVPVNCGTGDCSNIGEFRCLAGKWVEDCTPFPPNPEVCDGRDNDCDYLIDEDRVCEAAVGQ